MIEKQKKKKLLLLGGLSYLIPVINTAHDLGLHVITCDYVPDNIAHKYSDEYYNVSIIDREAVLNLARKLNIDGIMSFAVDPGVVTAAYVADKLNLPTCPYHSVQILQDKFLFRQFLSKNGFNVPLAKSFSKEKVTGSDLKGFIFPIMVKPVDSAGSKGVNKVCNKKELDTAIKVALDNSISGKFIIEEFIPQRCFSSDSDCFSLNGELVFCSFSNQYFDKKATNPYTPAGFSWPSAISSESQKKLKEELQRLIRLLNLGTSIYNVEVREGFDGKAYIMEVAPRGGGNRLSEVLKYATGVDLIKNTVKAAMGDTDITISQNGYKDFWAEIIIHSDKDGKFNRLIIDEKINRENLVDLDLWVKKGEEVKHFNAANNAIGTMILRFKTQKQLNQVMDNQKKWLSVVVD